VKYSTLTPLTPLRAVRMASFQCAVTAFITCLLTTACAHLQSSNSPDGEPLGATTTLPTLQYLTHVQNVRTSLLALAYLQQGKSAETRALLQQLLSDELTLLNGAATANESETLLIGLCPWREHLSAARRFISAEEDQMNAPRNFNSASQLRSIDRTTQVLEGICSAR